MKDQLISFETLELVKEKGFEERCVNYYLEVLEDTYCENGHTGVEYLAYSKGEIKLCDSDRLFKTKTKNLGYAPTQTHLQKWLREKHNIHIWITYFNSDNYFYCYNIENFEGLRQPQNESKTYEEALEIGLQEALKLIK
jgi:hypothetical protein